LILHDENRITDAAVVRSNKHRHGGAAYGHQEEDQAAIAGGGMLREEGHVVDASLEELAHKTVESPHSPPAGVADPFVSRHDSLEKIPEDYDSQRNLILLEHPAWW
jgi:hypothetical protein